MPRCAYAKGGRVKKSFADMVRSLGLMAVIVAAMLFIGARYLIFPGSADRMPATDYSGVVQGFHTKTNLRALVPTAVPAAWRANAARLIYPTSGVVQMHIGWSLPHSRYAGLDEATRHPNVVVADVLGRRGAAVTGTTTIAGATWQQRVSDLGEEALTRQVGAVTVVVTGNATDAELRLLAASLR
jgi:Protein of unknown function (DUF4245)